MVISSTHSSYQAQAAQLPSPAEPGSTPR